jgi:hypothetical protein
VGTPCGSRTDSRRERGHILSIAAHGLGGAMKEGGLLTTDTFKPYRSVQYMNYMFTF